MAVKVRTKYKVHGRNRYAMKKVLAGFRSMLHFHLTHPGNTPFGPADEAKMQQWVSFLEGALKEKYAIGLVGPIPLP